MYLDTYINTRLQLYEVQWIILCVHLLEIFFLKPLFSTFIIRFTFV